MPKMPAFSPEPSAFTLSLDDEAAMESAVGSGAASHSAGTGSLGALAALALAGSAMDLLRMRLVYPLETSKCCAYDQTKLMWCQLQRYLYRELFRRKGLAVGSRPVCISTGLRKDCELVHLICLA